MAANFICTVCRIMQPGFNTQLGEWPVSTIIDQLSRHRRRFNWPVCYRMRAWGCSLGAVLCPSALPWRPSGQPLWNPWLETCWYYRERRPWRREVSWCRCRDDRSPAPCCPYSLHRRGWWPGWDRDTERETRGRTALLAIDEPPCRVANDSKLQSTIEGRRTAKQPKVNDNIMLAAAIIHVKLLGVRIIAFPVQYSTYA